MHFTIALIVFQIKDCEGKYDSLISVPQNNNASLDTIRGFFQAFLSHKEFINHVINLGMAKLVSKNWIVHSKANETYKNFMELRDALNFNAKRLFSLVRKIF